MKTTASKENATSSQSSKPFFNKKGEGSFLSSTNEQEQPFFSPNPVFQKSPANSPFSVGNNAAHTPFFRPNTVVQTKLTINEPGDKYEQEADAMADRVMRMPLMPIFSPSNGGGRGEVAQRSEKEEEEDQVQRKGQPFQSVWGNQRIVVQRNCAACGEEEKLQRQEMEEEEPLQTKPLMRKTEGGDYTASPQLSSQLNSSKGGGNPLPSQTLASMNQAFGADFSTVRVHADSQASEMSRGINAKAFTYGNDIYFNSGQFSPHAESGKHLLAHELTHVVQQGERNIMISCKSETDETIPLPDWVISTPEDGRPGVAVPGYEDERDEYTEDDRTKMLEELNRRVQLNGSRLADFYENFIKVWTELVIDIGIEDAGLSLGSQTILGIISNVITAPIKQTGIATVAGIIGDGIINVLDQVKSEKDLDQRKKMLKEMANPILSKFGSESKIKLKTLLVDAIAYTSWLKDELLENLKLYKIPPEFPIISIDNIRFEIALEILAYKAAFPWDYLIDESWDNDRFSEGPVVVKSNILHVKVTSNYDVDYTFPTNSALLKAVKGHQIHELKGVYILVNFYHTTPAGYTEVPRVIFTVAPWGTIEIKKHDEGGAYYLYHSDIYPSTAITGEESPDWYSWYSKFQRNPEMLIDGAIYLVENYIYPTIL